MNPLNLLQKVPLFTNIRRSTGRFRRIRRVAVVGVLVVGLLFSGAVVGPGLAEERPAGGSMAAPSVVEFTCNDVRVVPPDSETSYSLVIHYVDTATGVRGAALIGPFTGTFDDEFGKTDIVLTEIDVRYDHGGGASGTIPARCR